MPLAYSYIRFSTEKQRHGDSIRRQLAMSEKYADEHGLTLDTALSLQDLGVSAYTKANIESGALRGFLDAVRSGQVKQKSVLLVESLDRLSRAEVMDALELFTGIINSGITIVTLTDNEEYSRDSIKKNWTQLVISISVMSRAHEESHTKSLRLKSVWEAKREHASELKMTRKCPSWLTLSVDRKTFITKAEAVKVVKRIIQMSKDGHGQASIAKRLNQEATPNISGSPRGWQSSYINKILTSPALFGEARFNVHLGGKRISVGEPLPNYYPALMSQEEWRSLQTVRKRRNTGGGGPVRKEQVTNLFSGLLRCGYCHHPMTIGGYGRKDPIKQKKYVVCSKAKRGLGCHFISWGLQDLETLLLRFLSELDFNEILRATEQNNPTQTLRDQMNALEFERIEIASRQETILDAIEKSHKTEQPAALIERLVHHERRLSEIEVQYKQLNEDLSLANSAERTLVHHQDGLIKLHTTLSTASGLQVGAIRLKLAEHIRQLTRGIFLFPGGWDGRIELDMDGRLVDQVPGSAKGRNRTATVSLQGGKLARIIVDHCEPTGSGSISVDGDVSPGKTPVDWPQ